MLDEPEEHLKKALLYTGSQAVQMRRILESPKGQLLHAIKKASLMLGELRTGRLSPKLYYELYNACFDALSQLETYLIEVHHQHHLADVYEIVQYTGNVLPRLYLMITVGCAFLDSGEAPREEVLKDMLEMARGIQHPLRGLFLRYYLGQRTGSFLNGTRESLQFSVKFTLTNFIEMNKLWVRYQHQGHSRDFTQREAERRQLETVMGSSILRLAQLDTGIAVFQDEILPTILEQVVQCRDRLAQEYLLDILVQAFPAEFHLETLETFLESLEFLRKDTVLGGVLEASIDRVLEVSKEKEKEKEGKEVEKKEVEEKEVEEKEVEEKEVEVEEKQEEVEEEEEEKVKKEDKETEKETNNDDRKAETPDIQALKLEPDSNLALETAKLYRNAVVRLTLPPEDRARLACKLLELYSVSGTEPPLTELIQLAADGARQSTEVERLLLSLFEQPLPAILSAISSLTSLLAAQSTQTVSLVAERAVEKLLAQPGGTESPEQILALFQVLMRSNKVTNSNVSRLVRLLVSGDRTSGLETLQQAYRAIREQPGGAGIVVSVALELLQAGLPAEEVSKLLKFVHKVCHDVSAVGMQPLVGFRLCVQAGTAADAIGAEEASYELFAEALTTYEEGITDSAQQVCALAVVIQALQQCSVFTTENYVPLAQRCVQYGQRLFKKPDQCRALLQACHLFWDNAYSDSRAVEETLSRALRAADSVMDTSTSIELFLNVLETQLYFLMNEAPTITPSSVNQVLDLIYDNLKNAESEDGKNLQLFKNRLSRISAFSHQQTVAFPKLQDVAFR